MTFDPIIADIRFGMGLSPQIAPPVSAQDMLTRLTGPDVVGEMIPIAKMSQARPSMLEFRTASGLVSSTKDTDAEAEAIAARAALREAGREAVGTFLKAEFSRAVHTTDGFRERLARFWADHFTVRPVTGIHRMYVSPYVEEAIRPHVAGDFAEMLIAAIASPMMILYLNQHQSMGPNSYAAQRNDRGLNENLARELLELHTLGVGGTYTQTDVVELAELLTGVTYSHPRGAYFRSAQAEPGSETVLGRVYGGDDASMEDVIAVLRDLAVHPDTARHLAEKLLVHFIGPEPDSDLVAQMAAAYLGANGQLWAMYDVMLSHDAAWSPEFKKVKQPFEFVASSMRALAVPRDVIEGASLQDVRNLVQRPLGVMGQVWQDPVGPDGWPEDDAAWITPQGMAGRITWAMQVPQRMIDLPDPRDFVYHALGPNAPEPVVFAAGAAETVSDGIGIVLSSAAFQRR